MRFASEQKALTFQARGIADRGVTQSDSLSFVQGFWLDGRHEPAVHEDTVASRMKDTLANNSTARWQLASH
jgi:hypothetical protein